MFRWNTSTGDERHLLTDRVALADTTWVDEPASGPVLVQTSAHGVPTPGAFADGVVRFVEPQRRVAPGQSVVLYDGDDVVGGGIAA